MTRMGCLLLLLTLAPAVLWAEELDNLSPNPLDPDSTANLLGRYDSPFSGESINNPFAAGNPYRYDSPTNPYGWGLRIEGR